MLVFPGSPALTPFRHQKLFNQLKTVFPALEYLYAEYVHFVEIEDSITSDEKDLIKQLLPRASVDSKQNLGVESEAKPFCYVVPRIGTRSPWSSKATDIAKNLSLKNVKRIERGIAYYLSPQINKIVLNKLKPLLMDPMVESLLLGSDMLADIFKQQHPKSLEKIALMERGKEALTEANSSLGLALTQDEIDYLTQAFKTLKRDPTDVELMMFAQANSEHCRHKIFNASWTIDGEAKPNSLFSMIKNTYEQSGDSVLSAYSDNAAVINGTRAGRFFPNWESGEYGYSLENVEILMKVETHNHPTAIAPFPGAGTGAGGEIRDEGAVGRGSKPKVGLVGFSVSNLRIPEFIQPWEATEYGSPKRISQPMDIMIEAPIGAAAFNNEFGRANICGYFRSFEADYAGQRWGYHKPIMLAGGYGNIRNQHIEKKPFSPGAKLLVLGGPAMLIGLGGGAASSMSSGSFSEDLDFASVQRQNPEIERRCQEVIDRCWQLGESNPIQFIHDVGAGGLSNAFPELVKDGGCGGNFELRQIPNDEPGMSPLEIWCNEAQERYVLAVKPEQLPLFANICQRERCPFAVVGEATDERHLMVNDRLLPSTPIDIPMSVVFGKPPKMHREDNSIAYQGEAINTENINLYEAIDFVLRHPTVASKNFLITIGDRSVGGQVVRDQMVGPWQVPVADCGITTASFDSFSGEAMSIGERTPVAILDGPASGRMAIGEAITNIAAAPIARLSDVKLSANWMAAAAAPGEGAKLYQTVEAVAMELCPALGITIPVGKDSMSMQTRWQSEEEAKPKEGEAEAKKSVTAPMSLVISAFAPVTDVRLHLTPQLRTDKGATELLYIDLGNGLDRLGGSILAQVYQQLGEAPADVDKPMQIKAFFELIQELILQEKILAYHDRSDGGLITTLIEMAFAGHCGVDINLDGIADNDLIAGLFNEELGAVIQVEKFQVNDVVSRFQSQQLPIHRLGWLNKQDTIRIEFFGEVVYEESRAVLQSVWSETSYRMASNRDNQECAKQEFDNILRVDPGLSISLTYNPAERITAPLINTSVKPKIAILREQGVNGHVEMAAAFFRVGFNAVDVHMSDLISGRYDLKEFKGLVACGGFSYGDVLGAGQGWAKSILFNSQLRTMFESFFHRQDSFTLGVCNGCQMLSLLKSLMPGAEHWPYFTNNLSEQFEARYSLVKIEESPSILMREMSGSHLPVVVDHAEGRIGYKNEKSEISLIDNKQVVFRYLNNDLTIAENYPANPNGSAGGVTAVTNADGRITIMMPHPERVFRSVNHSWLPESYALHSPWLRLFENARIFVA